MYFDSRYFVNSLSRKPIREEISSDSSPTPALGSSPSNGSVVVCGSAKAAIESAEAASSPTARGRKAARAVATRKAFISKRGEGEEARRRSARQAGARGKADRRG